jgi:signal peptidase
LIGAIFVKKIFAITLTLLFFNIIFFPCACGETIVMEYYSMMHGSEPSPETLDPGDVIDVVEIGSRDDIITYVEGKSKGYKKFGDYGDVIVCDKNAIKELTLIHRAVIWIEFNDTTLDYDVETGNWTGGSFDIPELEAYGLTGYYSIPDYGYNKENLIIDFRSILDNFSNITNRITGVRMGFRSYPHSGFLTKGDNNMMCDQNSLKTSDSLIYVEPINVDWIMGKAKLLSETVSDNTLIYVLIGVIVLSIMIVLIKIFSKEEKTEELKYCKRYKGRPTRRWYDSQLKNTSISRRPRSPSVRRFEPDSIRKLSKRERKNGFNKRSR